MIPKKTIEELIIKHANLEKDLSSEKIEKKEFAEKSKEYSNLSTIIDQAKNYLSFEENKNELEKILQDNNSDDELKKMAELELADLKTHYQKNEKSLKLFCYLKMKLTKKMQLLKLEQARVVLRPAYLLQIFLKCMKK